MNDVEIVPFELRHKDAVIDLTVRAWTPVFAKTRTDVPRFVYDAFYPDGWEPRQKADVAALLDTEPENFWLALVGRELAGFVGIRIHPEDRMGEIQIIAVAPAHQRQGIARQLMAFAERHVRSAGMTMIMVETVGDAGHEPARRAYEEFGFTPWPVARYFKPL
ncbi:MAG: GNAT family N-acetyltransferase [Pseudomonadota bacterium]